MLVFAPKEADKAETRVPLVPVTVKNLVDLGADVQVEAGIGDSLYLTDAEYTEAGAGSRDDRNAALAEADIVVRLGPPTLEDITQLKSGGIHLSYLDPFNRADLVKALAQAGASALSMEMIPRTTIAQKMDALSSQASLAGYEAVILAAGCLPKAFPMMMTPAGTIVPARVFVIGAGVAGLQAIATAKRLGARVDAFDTRPVVKEQVQSLGARFVDVDLGETGQNKNGYAKALSEEQLAKQREAMARCCAQADVVITTAQIFGRKAPLIVTADMVKSMKPGSVIIDLAVESGGNVEGARLGEHVRTGGVTIVGLANLPGRIPVDASLMYSSNVGNFLEHFWDKEAASFKLDREDEIIQGCLITHGGEIVHSGVRDAMK